MRSARRLIAFGIFFLGFQSFANASGGSMIGGGDQPIAIFSCQLTHSTDSSHPNLIVDVFDSYEKIDAPYYVILHEGMYSEKFGTAENVSAKIKLTNGNDVHLIFEGSGVSLEIMTETGKPFPALPDMKEYSGEVEITNPALIGITTRGSEMRCFTPR